MRWKEIKNRLQLSLMPNSRHTVASEMMLLNQQLIDETFSPDGIITKEFQKMLEAYGPDTPIDDESARELLLSLVKIAAAQRKSLADRVVKRVETGSLFKPYHKRLRKISKLAVQAEGCRRDAEVALDDYVIEYALFCKNRLNSYAQDPNDKLGLDDLEKVKAELNDLDELPPCGGAV